MGSSLSDDSTVIGYEGRVNKKMKKIQTFETDF